MSAVLDYPKRHPVSAQEYLRMGEAGVFAPEARLELIEGEIIEMAPIGSPHAGVVKILNRLLVRLAGERAIVSVQDPLVASERSVPQPDLALLEPRPDSYSRSHPRSSEVLLVIEVSDTTLGFDVKTKVPLYARCGIPEVWIVDVQSQALLVFRGPGPQGYGTSSRASVDEEVASAMIPEVRFAVRELFPG